jgi:hypothetical protein
LVLHFFENSAPLGSRFGPEVVQMPEQRAVELDAMADEALSVIDQQPQVELGAVQVRSREGLQTLLQRGAGNVERVDWVRLAALASALARLGGQVRRDPQHPLAALDQKPLERAGNVPAVLQRPHPLAINTARPLQQRAEPTAADRDGLLAEQLAGWRCDRGDRVRTLVSVRAEHDHAFVVLLILRGGRLVDTACWRRCHASIKSRQTSPTGDERQTNGSQATPGRQPQRESARRRPGPSPPRRTSPTTRIKTASLKAAEPAPRRTGRSS